MGYCFDCMAREKGFKNEVTMFSELRVIMGYKEVAEYLSISVDLAKKKMRDHNGKKNTWGGRNVKINGKFVREN